MVYGMSDEDKQIEVETLKELLRDIRNRGANFAYQAVAAGLLAKWELIEGTGVTEIDVTEDVIDAFIRLHSKQDAAKKS